MEQPVQKPASKAVVVVQESKAQWIIAIALVIITVVALVGIGVKMNASTYTKETSLIGVEKDQYQALFLANGQVYFGKLSQADEDTIRMDDIYYLQVQTPVQPKSDKPEDQQQQTSLAKLGNELHGPQDTMYIDRDQVVFWENLKGEKNSKVVDAINRYKESKKD